MKQIFLFYLLNCIVFSVQSQFKPDQVALHFLNDLKPFKEINPTAENIAQYIHKELSVIMNDKQIEVKSIKLWETEKSAVTFTG